MLESLFNKVAGHKTKLKISCNCCKIEQLLKRYLIDPICMCVLL